MDHDYSKSFLETQKLIESLEQWVRENHPSVVDSKQHSTSTFEYESAVLDSQRDERILTSCDLCGND